MRACTGPQDPQISDKISRNDVQGKFNKAAAKRGMMRHRPDI